MLATVRTLVAMVMMYMYRAPTACRHALTRADGCAGYCTYDDVHGPCAVPSGAVGEARHAVLEQLPSNRLAWPASPATWSTAWSAAGSAAGPRAPGDVLGHDRKGRATAVAVPVLDAACVAPVLPRCVQLAPPHHLGMGGSVSSDAPHTRATPCGPAWVCVARAAKQGNPTCPPST